MHLTDDAAGEFYQGIFAAADDAEGRIGPTSVPSVLVAGGEYIPKTGEGWWNVFAQPGELVLVHVTAAGGERRGYRYQLLADKGRREKGG